MKILLPIVCVFGIVLKQSTVSYAYPTYPYFNNFDRMSGQGEFNNIGGVNNYAPIHNDGEINNWRNLHNRAPIWNNGKIDIHASGTHTGGLYNDGGNLILRGELDKLPPISVYGRHDVEVSSY